MKIVNRRLQQTADISAERGTAFREFRHLTLILILLIAVLFLSIGLIVDTVVRRISFETESRIFGHPMWSQLAGSVTNDTRLTKLQPVLDALTADETVPPLPYRLVLVENNQPNAFAFPGGTIGVTSGLLDCIAEDIELAFVLAHELGHFHDRDHLRGLGRAIGIALTFSVVLGREMGANSLAAILQHVLQRGYSRKQETAADHYGVELVYRVYGRTQGVDRLFQMLRAEGTPPEWTYMFATHPSPARRIAELQTFADSLTPK